MKITLQPQNTSHRILLNPKWNRQKWKLNLLEQFSKLQTIGLVHSYLVIHSAPLIQFQLRLAHFVKVTLETRPKLEPAKLKQKIKLALDTTSNEKLPLLGLEFLI
jgi:hypothetical protein